MLGKKAPATTRKITFGDNVDQVSWHHTGNLDKLWKGVPHCACSRSKPASSTSARWSRRALERAIFITGGLIAVVRQEHRDATMPKIKHLEIYYGDDSYGGDCSIKQVMPLLGRTDLP